MLQVYNTFTRKKEKFEPINPPIVNMYSCGPTVYDYFHIGNARSFVSADLIRRFLIYKGFKVKFAMNLTDIDDKIINRAKDSGYLWNEIAEKYSNAFFEDIKKLKVKPADIYPTATGHIQEIIELIQKLENKGIAYNINGNVYFRIDKFNTYGALSGKNLSELESGARVDVEESKENPLDFALWKKAKPGEPFWESPWGKGRPGWHIECSAMSCKHLGETFDIHTGGSDLIFPHHENEIAQSEGASGKKFVNYWFHFGFLNIDNEKMSKSLGNFKTLRDILKIFPAQVLRLFYLTTHYSKPLNFTAEGLESAQNGLEKLSNFYSKLNEELGCSSVDGIPIVFDFEKFYGNFETEMDDDFNSPRAVAVIFEFAKEVNKIIATEKNIPQKFFIESLEFLRKTADDVLGIIDFSEVKTVTNSIESDLIELLIVARIEAKKDKNYRLADTIREGLTKLGISLQDSKEKTTYRRD